MEWLLSTILKHISSISGTFLNLRTQCDYCWCVNWFTSCVTVVTLKSSSARCSTRPFPESPTTTFYWLFLCSWTAQLLSDRPAVAVWLRGFKRLIDTSWVLWAWEDREFTALQPREQLRPGVAQIIRKKSQEWKFRRCHPNEVRMKLTLGPELLTIA